MIIRSTKCRKKTALLCTDRIRSQPCLKNSHDKRIFKAVRASELTLLAINLIKEKRDGVLKSRTAADGRKQRQWHTREQVTSPTISNNSLMALLNVFREIISLDVEGAYLLADQNNYALVKFSGESVNILCDVDDSSREFVTIERGARYYTYNY